MKKTVLLITCLLAAVGAFAQSHSFRDTSQVRYEQFDFDSFVWADTVYHGKNFNRYLYNPLTTIPLLSDDILQYNYTDNPSGVEVVGLSAAVFFEHGTLRAQHCSEFLWLYDAHPDSMELKAQVAWDEIDTAGRPNGRYLKNEVIACGYPSRCLDTIDLSKNRFFGIKIFDIYFDTPIVVYDSFYVGGTSRGMIHLNHIEPYGSICNYLCFTPTISLTDTCMYPVALWKLYHLDVYNTPPGRPTHQWYNIPSNQFLMVLPIINVVDSSFANAPACPRVSGIFLRGNYTDTVTLQWAYDALHDEFEVSYGPDGTAPDDGTVVTVRDNKWQFADSAYNDTQMVVYVRTVCREYDTLRWSGWSVPMYMRVHYDIDTTQPPDTTQQEGIDVLEDGGNLSRFVQLMPNPASGGVVVVSSYSMERVEVYDARGGKVYDSPAKGMSTGFDVSSWAKGTYVVLVRTPAGTAAKRLVVN